MVWFTWFSMFNTENMNRYKIYTTEAQTRKALSLGAPIEVYDNWDSDDIREANIFYKEKYIELDDYKLANRITAEEMIGWLEDQGIKINIEHSNVEDSMRFKIHKSEDFDYEIAWNFHYPSRKEATLAAIDAALDYLSKNK